jgi:hypothetical protein
VLLAWQVFEALRASPNFLSYFNRFGGGPDKGHEHLVDSSIDWGQDLPGLKQWLDSNGFQGSNHPPVYLSYFGTAFPAYYHIDAQELPGFPINVKRREPPPLTGGVYCISVTMLQAVYIPEAPGQWTAAYEQRYQDALYNLRLYRSTADNPKDRAALIAQTGEDFWWKLFHLIENLRFARLAAYLRRRTPDANIGHSILVYRLTDEDVARAVAGPAPPP